ncbi:PspA/IM30 family protein [Marilutibacter alkalisoli]|uniref:PspA/IM30 family protein n=1 Tax=Marilutibacter alkalisoli TaxID=2591633 RepID=A0A514BN45_9GAMM|nr:PspA/IM30 family protein [Lysobacter alkalisoli]QDH68814.1 PspA/IM30 family protein [Lysobacter alkalisoli]
MNIWSKLLTALRGGATEVGESIIDGHALRILDQEIRDSDVELRRSKEALAEIMAKLKLAEGRLAKSNEKIAEYEAYTIKALDSGDENLAREVAGKIATLETVRDGEQQQVEQFFASVADLRKSITQAETNIRRLKQQVDTVKATESVQRAQSTVAHRYSGSQSKLQTAVDSLERIKQKQAERGARMEAAAELAKDEGQDAVDAKLKEAGIIADAVSADSVLERLKKKQAV